jgi:hypothetical protein
VSLEAFSLHYLGRINQGEEGEDDVLREDGPDVRGVQDGGQAGTSAADRRRSRAAGALLRQDPKSITR